MFRRQFLATMALLVAAPAAAQSPPETLFRNVRVFNGTSPALSPPTDVLVRGNIIAAMGADARPAPGATVIEGQGRTLMPGLIDAHTHIMFASLPQLAALTADLGFMSIAAAREAEAMLMRGFTSIRDLGGPAFGLKRAVDAGLVPGPRIYPAGAMISQSGGHGDFRLPTEMPAAEGSMTYGERVGANAIADSPDLVRKRAREQLALGATQLKLMAGGGVASSYDPLDVTQYSVPELRAAVEAAQNWGTYVTVHAYTPRAIRQAIEAGVQCIDHGQLIDEPTAQLMAKNDTWLSLQPFIEGPGANSYPAGSPNAAKQREMFAGTDNAYALAKKYKLKVAWGTDTLFSPANARLQGAILAKMTRWYTPAETLIMATSTNARLLAMSGPRNPYPGALGVVEAGALADLLLVDGDPTTDLTLVTDPAKNFLVIMKDGRIYKNITGR
ncbi:MAG: amidohydrolase family protein [Polymorphobacter sp.]|uniref:metal-dependent hydrolase family protein n=1 Tax=Polymorphobacter sp. TaxID=1909290 RepID=UPI003A8A24E0